MSVKIRLTKTGKRNQIQFRIVVQDTRTKRDGKFLEILGNFNPESGGKLTLKKNEYEAWIKKGAKPTPSLLYLIEYGKLPKKAKKVKVEINSQNQKPAEPKTETPAAQKEEASQSETKDEPAQKAEDPKIQPTADDSKGDSQPSQENVESEKTEAIKPGGKTKKQLIDFQPKADPPLEEAI